MLSSCPVDRLQISSLYHPQRRFIFVQSWYTLVPPSQQLFQVYVVPNGGSVADSTRMFNVDVVTNETVLIEPSFPIVLDTNGDKLSVGAVFQPSTYSSLVIRRR